MAVDSIHPHSIAGSLSEMEFRELASFNEGGVGVFWSEAGGPSPWEMHPDCEEMLQILEGEVEVEILPEDGGVGEKTVVSEGELIVIPRRCWHRQTLLKRTKELYLTPGASEHSMKDDPRG